MKRYAIAAGILVACAIVVALAVFFVFFRKGSGAGGFAPVASFGTVVAATSGSEIAGQDLKTYSSQAYHFSIQYPAELAAEDHIQQGALAVLIANQDGSELVRIFVTPYDEPTISRQRFLTDLPSGVMNGNTGVTVDGVAGAMFESNDSLIGNTIEIWFIRDGLLYEVDTYASQAAWLQQLMQSWKFI